MPEVLERVCKQASFQLGYRSSKEQRRWWSLPNALVRNIKENTRQWVTEKLDYVPLAFSPGYSKFSNCSVTGFVLFLVTVHACQILTVSLGTDP